MNHRRELNRSTRGGGRRSRRDDHGSRRGTGYRQRCRPGDTCKGGGNGRLSRLEGGGKTVAVDGRNREVAGNPVHVVRDVVGGRITIHTGCGVLLRGTESNHGVGRGYLDRRQYRGGDFDFDASRQSLVLGGDIRFAFALGRDEARIGYGSHGILVGFPSRLRGNVGRGSIIHRGHCFALRRHASGKFDVRAAHTQLGGTNRFDRQLGGTRRARAMRSGDGRFSSTDARCRSIRGNRGNLGIRRFPRYFRRHDLRRVVVEVSHRHERLVHAYRDLGRGRGDHNLRHRLCRHRKQRRTGRAFERRGDGRVACGNAGSKTGGADGSHGSIRRSPRRGCRHITGRAVVVVGRGRILLRRADPDRSGSRRDLHAGERFGQDGQRSGSLEFADRGGDGRGSVAHRGGKTGSVDGRYRGRTGSPGHAGFYRLGLAIAVHTVDRKLLCCADRDVGGGRTDSN